MNDEKLDALLEAMAENTTTLIDVQKQSAATSASTKDARTYIQTIAKQTNWETNGEIIAATLTHALEQDHEALHAASQAASEMRALAANLTHKADRAAEAQQKASNTLHSATGRLQKAAEVHEQGKWSRMGMIALIGALCGAVGFFAREPAARFTHLWDAKSELQQSAASPDCGRLGGTRQKSGERFACVIWER